MPSEDSIHSAWTPSHSFRVSRFLTSTFLSQCCRRITLCATLWIIWWSSLLLFLPFFWLWWRRPRFAWEQPACGPSTSFNTHYVWLFGGGLELCARNHIFECSSCFFRTVEMYIRCFKSNDMKNTRPQKVGMWHYGLAGAVKRTGSGWQELYLSRRLDR